MEAGGYIVQGPPGAGQNHSGEPGVLPSLSEGGRSVYITLLAESHSRMFRHLRRMAFFDESKIPESVTTSVASARSSPKDWRPADAGPRHRHQEVGGLAIIDGLVSAHESAPSDPEFKKFLHGSRCSRISRGAPSFS